MLTFLYIFTLCFITQAIPLDRRFLMLFGHQYNNPGNMGNEFGGTTGGSSGSNVNTGSGSNGGTSGGQTGVPGDATNYLDKNHHYFHSLSSGHAGYVQHAGNGGPDFASQSVSTGHGTDHLPGKCPWIGCSSACQDIDSVTGCVICITGCSAQGTNGISSSSQNTGSGNGITANNVNTGAATGPGTGQGTGGNGAGLNTPNTGVAGQQGSGTTGGQSNGGSSLNSGTASQNAGNTAGNGGGTNSGTVASSTCPPFPSNCPRGSAAIINGCPQCNLSTTTSATAHKVTCAPTRCVAPCNKGVSIDPTTRCPVCKC